MLDPKFTPTEKWLDEYGDILYRFALIRVRSESTAEDLVQETLLAGLQSVDKYTGQSTLRTWLIGILKHKIIDHFRKNRSKTLSLDDLEMSEDLFAFQFDTDDHWKIKLIDWSTPEEVITNAEFSQIFQQCISRLPQHMADLFMLNTIEGLSTESCCKVLNIKTTNQMWVALSRTRMKLRLCLDTLWFNKE